MKMKILSLGGVPITLVALAIIYAIGNTMEIPRSPTEAVRVQQQAMPAPPRSGQTFLLSDDVLAGRSIDDLEQILKVRATKNYSVLSEKIINGSAVLLDNGQRIEVVGFTNVYDTKSFKNKSGYEVPLERIININIAKVNLIKSSVSIALVRIGEGDLIENFFYVPTESLTPGADR